MQPRNWKWFASAIVLSLFAAAALPALGADDADQAGGKAGVVDGAWQWSFTTQNGQTFEQKAKLKQDGEKLKGVVIGGRNSDNETEIKDGKINAKGELSFTVTREFQGQSRTTTYEGKLEGDTIKGKSKRERDGQTQEREWVAKRVKEEGKA